MNSTEIWKMIPGYGDYYEASSLGRIRSIDRRVNGFSARGNRPVKIRRSEHLISQSIRHGYPYVNLYWDGKEKHEQVHTLVLLAFVGARPDGMQACHNNGIRKDNRPENLRWDTFKSNQEDIDAHGNRPKGGDVGTAKLSEEAALEILSGSIGPAAAVRKFGIGRTQYYRIRNGKSWQHLNVNAFGAQHGVEFA
ncbi:phage-related protein [Janthinobacterium sp. Marseille]|nr:NUMOD4 motif-containing HNH endonuclease [Janthinobacterium sp. Marseille]ABR91760.1 phage-related protein [Janthinobacterium sp. Marseille]